MPGDVGGLLLVGLVPAAYLLFQGLHYRRQQATQAQLGAATVPWGVWLVSNSSPFGFTGTSFLEKNC